MPWFILIVYFDWTRAYFGDKITTDYRFVYVHMTIRVELIHGGLVYDFKRENHGGTGA